MGKMMKCMALLGMLCSLFLTGCMGGIKEETRNNILKCLTREGYIGKGDSLEYDETIMWDGPLPDVNYYDYIYSDENGQLYNVRIDSNSPEDAPWGIKVFYDVEIEEYVNKYDEDLEMVHVTMTDYAYERELKVERRSWFIFSWLAVMED